MTDENERERSEPDRSREQASEDDAQAQDEIRRRRPRGEERHYTGEPLETEDGEIDVPAQQPVGEERERGGGEWPDPRTPPRSPAPGAADEPTPDEKRRGRDPAG